MSSTDLGPWKPASLAAVTILFASAPMRWWIAGGYALELHFGRSWRNHDDIDVSVLRSDAHELRSVLPGWDIHVAAAGVLTPWTGRELTAAHSQNNLWCRRSVSGPWNLDVVLSDGDDTSWIYRRNPSIHRPWADAVLTSSDGTPYLAPEVQLLFKSRNPRPKDDLDAATTIPLLTNERRSWLAEHLDAHHPWQVFVELVP